MPSIQDRKSDFYSQKQSVRDELSAPRHLDTAGESLLRFLSRKQMRTETSLEVELKVSQNFEKGEELSPDNRRGVASLEEFQRLIPSESSSNESGEGKVKDLKELMRDTGMTRHELELGLREKPDSTVSKLYRFALENLKQETKKNDLPSQMPEHPINHLKEIEEECFGGKKMAVTGPETQEKGKVRVKKKSKTRKRKRKNAGSVEQKQQKPPPQPVDPRRSPTPASSSSQDPPEISRPSLWDVKDMKKWSESRQIGCQPPPYCSVEN